MRTRNAADGAFTARGCFDGGQVITSIREMAARLAVNQVIFIFEGIGEEALVTVDG
jgi:hypothetical protein